MIEHTPHTVDITFVDHIDAVNLIAQAIADTGPIRLDAYDRESLAEHILEALAHARILLMRPSNSGHQELAAEEAHDG